MPYPALPSARRRHYEIDGSIAGANTSGFSTGIATQFSSASMLAMNEETPSVDSNIFGWTIGINTTANAFFFMLFPEPVDLSFFISRFSTIAGVSVSLVTMAGSPDTTSGVDGTWTNITTSGTTVSNNGTADWWRSTAPASLTANNTNLRGVRWQFQGASGNTSTINLRNIYLWGTKHSGATPDDIIFLESDGTTEWPNDDDWGDLNAGSAAVTHTYYVKNASATKTANSVVVAASGSDNERWTS